jgi:hypothetical protein
VLKFWRVAQRLEHLPYKRVMQGSSPAVPTKYLESIKMKIIDSMVDDKGMLYLLMQDRGQYIGVKAVLDGMPKFSTDYLLDQYTRVGSMIFGIFEIYVKNPSSWKEAITKVNKIEQLSVVKSIELNPQLFLPKAD